LADSDGEKSGFEDTVPGLVVKGSFGAGVGWGALFTVAALLGSALFMMAGGLFVILGVGVAQALWMGPAYFHFRSKGATETAKGIAVVAGIVFLLNASCWGLMGTMTIGR
jgi:hypothetical protein